MLLSKNRFWQDNGGAENKLHTIVQWIEWNKAKYIYHFGEIIENIRRNIFFWMY